MTVAESRADAEAFMRNQPTEHVWVRCMFCHEDTLVIHKTHTIKLAEQGLCTLGGVCEDCAGQ